MKRMHLLLAGLVVVLLVVAFWVLLWQPQRDELAAIEVSIADEQAEQGRLAGSINRLRDVRRESPEIESELTAFESIVPEGSELPAALRQLQLAADESGVVLQTVSTGRPTGIPDSIEGLSSISLSAQVVGEYFQVVDFLRRVEDPLITPRGVEWSAASLSPTEYPELNVSLTGSLFAVITAPAPPPSEGEPADDAETDDEAAGGAEGTGAGEGDDGDTDVGVDIDEEET